MSIKVCFRGPMLFMTDSVSGPAKDEVNRVLIPDATAAKKHEDETPAVPHFAGLLLIEKGQLHQHIPLAGRTVEIIAQGGTGLPKVDTKFLGVPPVHEMLLPAGTNATPVRRVNKPDHEPIVITFQGGSMSGTMEVKEGKVELTRHKAGPVDWKLTAMPLWESTAATVTIRLTGGVDGGGDIVLGPDSTAYIYNWDTGLPTEASLKHMNDPANDAVDHDFKWVYSLLKPVDKEWTDWLAEATATTLPTPRAKTGGIIGFTPATCNSARVVGM